MRREEDERLTGAVLAVLSRSVPRKLSLCLVFMLANSSSVHPVFFSFTRVVCMRACWWGIERLIDSLCTVSSQRRPTGVAAAEPKYRNSSCSL